MIIGVAVTCPAVRSDPEGSGLVVVSLGIHRPDGSVVATHEGWTLLCRATWRTDVGLVDPSGSSGSGKVTGRARPVSECAEGQPHGSSEGTSELIPLNVETTLLTSAANGDREITHG